MNHSEWPLHFSFDSDDTCQNIFKPYIESQLRKLAAYDALRPDGHAYEFDKHSYRVAEDVKAMCGHLNLPEHIGNNMYWAVLPHDIGKMALPVSIWDTESKPDEHLKRKRRTHTQTGVALINQAFGNVTHPFKDLMLDIILYHHEKMDGTGDLRAPADKLSMPVRLTIICDSFDGWSVKRPHFEPDRDLSVQGVLTRMTDDKGGAFFDMELLESFKEMKLNQPT